MNCKAWIPLSIAALALSVLAFPAVAGHHEEKSVTLEGKVMCAKCALHEEGRTECQNVLVVEKGDESKHYYMAKTEANDEFGEVCMATPAVRVTGKIEKKDGKAWIMAESIERVKDDES